MIYARSPSRRTRFGGQRWLVSRQEVADGDLDGWRTERRHSVGRAQHIDHRIVPSVWGRRLAGGLALHLEHAVDQIDDPVLGAPAPSVEARLVLTVEVE